jgi:hypothetical protein
MSRFHDLSRDPTRSRVSALALLGAAVSTLVLPLAGASATDDGTCVGKGEYKAIRHGMTISQLADALHGQAPFADVEGRGKQRVRWYAACDAWQPVKDVMVTYHQPVVGRRTVTKRALKVYVPAGGGSTTTGHPH